MTPVNDFKERLWQFCQRQISKNISVGKMYAYNKGYCEAMMTVQEEIKNIPQKPENAPRIDKIENYDRWHHFEIIGDFEPIYGLED